MLLFSALSSSADSLRHYQAQLRQTLTFVLLFLVVSCGGQSASNNAQFDQGDQTSEEEMAEQPDPDTDTEPDPDSEKDPDTEPDPDAEKDPNEQQMIEDSDEELARLACKNAANNTLAFVLCEQENFARANQATIDQATDLGFIARWQSQSITNLQEFVDRGINDRFWNSVGNLCATHSEQCTGDPYRYADVAATEVTAGSEFYQSVGQVIPINFYDSEGARLSGRIWAPKERQQGQTLPAVVIINGSVQAPATLYWWGAQLLAQQGYLVMTFDVRAQGRSDTFAANGQTGSNANSVVFRRNLIDAIDFFYSTPEQLYPHNLAGSPGFVSDSGQAMTTAHNPLFDWFDRQRLGVIGHSLGAIGVSVVQGEQPWPGELLEDNPIDAVVAWDNLMLANSLDGVDVKPRVPAMGQSGDYFLTPMPMLAKPDPLGKSEGFLRWQEAGIDSMQINIRSATHYEWSLLPTFPTTPWTGGVIVDPVTASEAPGWAQPMAQYYTLAWMDRWLKQAGEPGFDNADERLLNHRPWRARFSFYYDSLMNFSGRDGQQYQCTDLAEPCESVTIVSE